MENCWVFLAIITTTNVLAQRQGQKEHSLETQPEVQENKNKWKKKEQELGEPSAEIFYIELVILHEFLIDFLDFLIYFLRNQGQRKF